MTTSTSRLFGRYEVVRELGAGGMGRVFLATLSGAGGISRRVALKTVRPERANSKVHRRLFLREATALAAIHHRNVVQLVDFGTDASEMFIAMEYLEGRDLQNLSGLATLPTHARLWIVAEACRGLQAIHDHGLVHGDVSPSNIVVCDDGSVKLVDLGLARVQGAENSSSDVRGKMAYLPREAVVGQAPDHLVDIYGLGLTLYRFLTGENPYRGANDLETYHRIMESTAPAPLGALEPLPAGLDEVVLKAINPDRGLRYGSSREFATALEPYCREMSAAALVKLLAPTPQETRPHLAFESYLTEAESQTASTMDMTRGRPHKTRNSPVGWLAGALFVVLMIGVVTGIFMWRGKTEVGPEVHDSTAAAVRPSPARVPAEKERSNTESPSEPSPQEKVASEDKVANPATISTNKTVQRSSKTLKKRENKRRRNKASTRKAAEATVKPPSKLAEDFLASPYDD